ncbi:MAG: ComF family protein [Planctomycetaceae bacterium]|nr:ComF family protein [Planctomycetaceae bacterium]
MPLKIEAEMLPKLLLTHLKAVLTPLLDLICPPLCPLCGQHLSEDTVGLSAGRTLMPCPACAEALITPNGGYCLRCGGRRFLHPDTQQYAPPSQRTGCIRCRSTQFRFTKVIALGEYENELRRLILQMKTEKTGRIADALTSLLFQERKEAILAEKPDFVIPVPSHWKRYYLSRGGINPAEKIAQNLADFLRIPMKKHLLRRIRSTELQHTLSPKSRHQNVYGAFVVHKKSITAGKIAGKNILLVDDIFTTGATCNEIAKVLKKAGAKSIAVCVIARAEGQFVSH